MSCALSPCFNDGTCIDLESPPYYRCVCPPALPDTPPVGAHCELLSSCDQMPCPQHSSCMVADGPGAYRCVCDGDECDEQEAGALASLDTRDRVTGV